MADDDDVVRIQVLFFASARQAANDTSQIEICIKKADEQPADTHTLRGILAERYPKLAAIVLDDKASVTLALNEEYVPPGQVLPLKNGDTVALIPPISGG